MTRSNAAIVSNKQLLAKVKRDAAKYHKANAARIQAVEAIKESVRLAHEDGASVHELAKICEVDPARTMRRWLGLVDY